MNNSGVRLFEDRLGQFGHIVAEERFASGETDRIKLRNLFEHAADFIHGHVIVIGFLPHIAHETAQVAAPRHDECAHARQRHAVEFTVDNRLSDIDVRSKRHAIS